MPSGHAAEAGLRAGHLVDRVEQHFGVQPLGIVAREVLLVVLVALVRLGAQLIGRATCRSCGTRCFRSKLLSTKSLASASSSSGFAGRVGHPHVVFRIDQAAAEEVLPVAVDQRLGEERVVLGRPSSRPARAAGRDPAARSSGAAPRPVGFTPWPVLGLLGRATPRRWIDPVFVLHFALLAADLREERREAVVVLLAPLLERMVVAAGTLDAQAQEQLGRVFDLGRLRPSLRDTRRRAGSCPASPVAVRISRTNWSYGLFSCRLCANPVVERERRRLVDVLPPLVAQDRAPLVGEVVGVVGAVEQRDRPGSRACSGR